LELQKDGAKAKGRKATRGRGQSSRTSRLQDLRIAVHEVIYANGVCKRKKI